MDELLVTYDISSDRRRRRVFKLLHTWGVPLQESVFICSVEPARFGKMRRRLEKEIDHEADSLLFVFLCGRCSDRLDQSGRPLVFGPGFVRVV